MSKLLLPQDRKFCRFPFPDERDRKFRLRPVASLRTSRYWRDTSWNPDQGSEPSCVGFGAAQWLAASPISQFLDPTGLYQLATYVDEWRGDWRDYAGTSVRAVMKVLQDLGCIVEYRWETKIAPLVQHVLERGPVLLGTVWTVDMCYPDKQGLIHATGEVYGGHCFLWSGVNTSTGMGRIHNSWSNDWGDNGHAYLSLKDLQFLLDQDGEACAGIERKPAAA